MEKLKPCPFCGNKDVRIVKSISCFTSKIKGYYVNCLCGARFYDSRYKKQAVAVWNRRVFE